MGPLAFIATILDLYIWIIIIGAILSWLIVLNLVNRRNPIVLAVADVCHRLTEPALRPIRRRLPNFGPLDLSPLVLIFLLLFIINILRGNSIWDFFAQIIGFYITIVVIHVILSWLIALDVVNRRNHIVYMIAEAFHRFTEPALRPIRRMLPDLGGLDISPLILIFLLIFITNYVIYWLKVNIPI